MNGFSNRNGKSEFKIRKKSSEKTTVLIQPKLEAKWCQKCRSYEVAKKRRKLKKMK